MHARPAHHPGNRLWLLSGTGEGPLLAKALLARGWRLRVWVVSGAAARSYSAAPALELAVGPIGGPQAVAAALVQARTQLFRNYRELLDRSREVTALRERALPRMEAALKNTEYAYERGRYSYLELVDAQRELLSVRDSLIDAATEYHLTLIEIERLTGTAVSR